MVVVLSVMPCSRVCTHWSSGAVMVRDSIGYGSGFVKHTVVHLRVAGCYVPMVFSTQTLAASPCKDSGSGHGSCSFQCWSRGHNGSRVRHTRCLWRMVDSLDRLELPLALFKRKRVRYDPFFGIRVGEASRPGPPASGVSPALKFAASARRDPSCGFGTAAPPPAAIKALRIVTANCSCFKSIQGFLEKRKCRLLVP